MTIYPHYSILKNREGDAMFSIISDDVQRNELEVFYKENRQLFYYIAYSKLHNKEGAEDAVQDAFAEIAKNPDGFFGVIEAKRIAYVSRIIMNVSIDLLKKDRRLSVEILEEDVSNEDIGNSLEDVSVGNIVRDELKKLIKSLPGVQGKMLVLHCFAGLKITECAKKLGISEAAAKWHLHTARLAVRQFLKERDYE